MEVKFLGEPIKVKGNQIKVGDKAPDAILQNGEGEEVQLADILKQVTILSIVPDVTTETCHLQTKKFAELAKEAAWDFYTVSRNTPVQFKQWNADNESDIKSLTDHKQEFGDKYGLEIELNGHDHLTRSVIIIDQQGTVQYTQYVEEVSEQPNYDEVMNAVNQLI
ncbi:redoxin family protein [Facklamia sp. DSM 111018]|uniref:Redoxin family protein n=1 Tax=Facklamia lactis TaxID=2749967 RepID=A0ABS0LNC5_9LACT|nr:redoxin family protein [Facklamia lactis]MBG9979664.1 redoxin family protein [Facklamia lactis]MBG9985656.1 redoxin family protein [Facklamia lactis]